MMIEGFRRSTSIREHDGGGIYLNVLQKGVRNNDRAIPSKQQQTPHRRQCSDPILDHIPVLFLYSLRILCQA